MPPDRQLLNNNLLMAEAIVKTTRIEQFGFFLWLLAFILIFIKVIFEPGSHSVVDSYLLGAERWSQQKALYSGPGGFIYTPLFAVLFTPFLYIPEALADFIWRMFIMCLYLYSLARLVLLVSDQPPGQLKKWLGLMSIIAVPIAFSGFRNGQVNVILTAVMMLVTCQIAKKRWNQAAILLALVMSLKPTFIVFFLLASTLFRPFWWRVPLFLMLFLATPILAAAWVYDWSYGWQQYLNFIDMARSAMIHGQDSPNFASLFNIPPQVMGLFIPHKLQTILKVILAVCTWLACVFALKRMDKTSALMYLLTLASCYHLLFNPRSVNTDYIILGTVLALWFTCAIHLWHNKALAWTFGLLALAVLEAFDLSRWLVPGSTSWVNPLAGFTFTIVVMVQLFNQRRFSLKPLQK